MIAAVVSGLSAPDSAIMDSGSTSSWISGLRGSSAWINCSRFRL